MTDEEFYGQALVDLKTSESYLLEMIAGYPDRQASIRPVACCQSGIQGIPAGACGCIESGVGECVD